GFRYDFVKGYGAWMITAVQEYRYNRNGKEIRPFGVAEDWDYAVTTIDDWLSNANSYTDNPVAAFDFPLRAELKRLCDEYGYSLANLGNPNRLDQAHSVTFVDNHDLDNKGGEAYNPVFNDKILAYAYILTHEGYPCVFWRDYYEYDLGK